LFGMTRRTTQVLTEHVPATDVVRRFYVDLDNITALHPLVVSVRSTRKTGDGGRVHAALRGA
jgi:hypothetical protein